MRPLARRDARLARRIGQAVTRLAQTGQGDITKLTGREEWHLRVGTWRVRFRFDHDAHSIVIVRVLPRREAYRE